MATSCANSVRPSYTYKPLPPSAQTRVLEIQPSMDLSAPLHCRLLPMDLIDEYREEYEALSYTWGQPNFTHELVIGQHYAKVITPNLHEALLRFRNQLRVRRIWVDAVCISQDDPVEKSRQIPFMSEIYRYASTILVWLSNDEKPTAYVKRINLLAPKLTNANKVQLELSAAITDIVSLPWFNRRWVIQEVVLNPSVTLFAGPLTLPWTRLLQVQAKSPVYILQHLAGISTLGGDINTWRGYQHLAGIWEQSTIKAHPESRNGILGPLKDFHDSKCVDDRDRIYPFSSLASDIIFTSPITTDERSSRILGDRISQTPARKGFAIDYTMSTENVYATFARHLVESEVISFSKLLGISAEQIRDDSHPHLKGVSSWAPDWRLETVGDWSDYHFPLDFTAKFEFDDFRTSIYSCNDRQGLSRFPEPDVIIAAYKPRPQQRLKLEFSKVADYL
ncbi:hypothetical protein DL763_004807 [Monosporascus cannonballus]|nr:hypothetical protein DL763_004807 [Monosporascus cannonballus]